jgi:hypothetical protein
VAPETRVDPISLLNIAREESDAIASADAPAALVSPNTNAGVVREIVEGIGVTWIVIT